MVVATVEVLGVRAVQAVHAGAEVRRSGLDEQVDVIAHQAVAEAPPLHPLGDAAERREVARVVASSR